MDKNPKMYNEEEYELDNQYNEDDRFVHYTANIWYNQGKELIQPDESGRITVSCRKTRFFIFLFLYFFVLADYFVPLQV